MTLDIENQAIVIDDKPPPNSFQKSTIERLYGRYKNTQLVDDLEAEHTAEILISDKQMPR